MADVVNVQKSELPTPQALHKRTGFRVFVLIAISAIAALVAYYFVPSSVPELGRRTIAIFVFAAILWASEALPLYATSLTVIGLEILMLAEIGGLAGFGGLSYKSFLSPFASGVILLFMGGFLLSKAITKHKLDAENAPHFQKALVLAVPFGANIGGVGTPIGTPPNAIAFASGRITAEHMWRAGGIISLIGAGLLLIGYRIVLPIIF